MVERHHELGSHPFHLRGINLWGVGRDSVAEQEAGGFFHHVRICSSKSMPELMSILKFRLVVIR